MLKIGVLVSGSGAILDSIAKAVEKKIIPDAKIAVVISSKPKARALYVARNHGLRVEVLDSAKFEGQRDDYDSELLRTLEKYGVTPESGLVVLVGFTRLLGPRFVSKFRNMIMNMHPSLLPSLPGLNAERKALDRGVRVSGCTIHLVDEGVDTGPIILQASVPVLDDDTLETLSKRILLKGKLIYPEAIKLFAEGKLMVIGRRVKIIGS